MRACGGGVGTEQGEGMCERMRENASVFIQGSWLQESKECATWSPDTGKTRSGWLSGAVTFAGFACVKAAPEQTPPDGMEKGPQTP